MRKLLTLLTTLIVTTGLWAVNDTISLVGATSKSANNKTAADFTANSTLSVGAGQELTSLTVGRSAATGVIYSSYDNKSNTMGTSTTYYLVHPYNNGSKVKWSASGDNLFYVDFVIPSGCSFTVSKIDYGFATQSGAFSVVVGVKDITSSPTDKYTSSSIAVSSGGTAVSSISSLSVTLTEGTYRFYVIPTSSSDNTGKYWGLSKVMLIGEYADASCTLSNPSVDGGGIYRIGEDITLTASVTGTPTSYTWKNAAGTTVGTTNPLVISDCSYSDADTYTCFMSDGNCEKSASATVVVKKVCPVNGSVFSMTITDADGTVYTDASADNWLLIGATYDGGKAYAGSQSSTGRSPKISGTEFDFNVSSGGSVVVMLVLDCELEEGDIISLTSSADKEFKIQKTLTDALVTTTSKKYTIPENSKLIGLDTIYILRNNSACKFSKIDITRPIYRTITFDSDGGSDVDDIVLVDGEVASKPTDPTKSGYVFAGWYHADTAYVWSTPVIEDLDMLAHWNKLYTVSFIAGEGEGSMDSEEYLADAAVTLPACTFSAPTGKEFDAWRCADSIITQGKFTMPAKDVEITALWKAELARYKVAYYDGEKKLGDELVEVGSHPTATGIDSTKNYCTFAAWQLSSADVDLDDVSGAKNDSITLFARYTVHYASSVNIEQLVLDEGTSYDIKGHLTAAGYVYANLDALDSLNDLENKTNRNYAFLGLKVKKATSTISLLLKANSKIRVKLGNVGNNVNLIVNGGSPASKSASFDYTADATDDTITIQSTGTNTVVFKQIMIDEPLAEVVLPDPSAYLVTIAATTNGTVTANWPDKKYRTPVGATVTLTVTPASGYAVASVKYNDGEDHVIAKVDDTYSFVMPAAAVTVSATFSSTVGIDNTVDKAKAVKFIENGQVVIFKDGKYFNVLGIQIR